MAISNKKKARELAKTLMGDDRNIEPLVDLLLQAMQWKDEQHKQEKQQWIDKACEWLKNNIDDYYTTCEFEEWFDEMFEDFKHAMKGE